MAQGPWIPTVSSMDTQPMTRSLQADGDFASPPQGGKRSALPYDNGHPPRKRAVLAGVTATGQQDPGQKAR